LLLIDDMDSLISGNMSANTRLWVIFPTDVAYLYLFALISLIMDQFYMILGCFPFALMTPAYPIHTSIVSRVLHSRLRTLFTIFCGWEKLGKSWYS
jgi:hypothetical protein